MKEIDDHRVAAEYPPYTCLMSVYNGEKPDYLACAMKSILNQTVPPREFLIIIDGPLRSELWDVLNRFEHDNSCIKIVPLKKNVGLWNALRVGVEQSAYDLILRMDSDDFSLSTRAEKQLACLVKNPEIGCCGTNVEEFDAETNNVIAYVDLPCSDADVRNYARRRNPIRHPSLMYRKQDVLRAGNYQKMPFFEDYDLILRMLSSGVVVCNLPYPLVKMRVNNAFYERRGSVRYLRHMCRFRLACAKRGDVSAWQFITSVIPHAAVCIMPNFLRTYVYNKFLRKKRR